MSLPVSQYEALLAEVRGLRRKAQHVQQLAKPLIREEEHQEVQGSFRSSNPVWPSDDIHYKNDDLSVPLDYTMDSLLLDRQRNGASSPNYNRVPVPGAEASSEEEFCVGGARSSTQLSVSSEPCHRNRNPPSSLYHGTWPVERTMWNSEPSSLGNTHEKGVGSIETHMDVTSVMSFASSSGGVPLDRVLGSPDRSTRWSSQQLEAKMDVVHSLLSMLGSQDHVDMGETLLALSTCPESCLAMRQSGCIPLLVQLVQSDKDSDTRKKASQALHNLVNSQPDEKLRKREVRILKLIETTRNYTEALRNNLEIELESSTTSEGGDKHPVQTVAHLMKLSFDEGHRQAICQLGGIHTIASLVEAEHSMHGSTPTESHCILMRRYACMALTNLTFGDSGNKALLCSFRDFMRALVLQLESPSDELRQVTASVLRNLSWRADSTSKEILRDVGSVTGLMKSAMLDNKENTLKSILSALWNLSAHCTENKSEICAVDGALGFLVTMLTYKTPSKSLAIIENSGGILRNISSQIAVRDDYREILRRYNCLQILLDQLKSPSLTIVSNACGALWNLSAKCNVDQEALWQMGAPAMLRSLNHSKHNMIAMGSSAALKNLLSAKPQHAVFQQMDQTALSLNLPELPTLGARKQKSLLQDLDQSLSETYENIEKDSPVKSKVDKTSSIIDFMQGSHKPRSLKSCSPPEYLKQKVDDLSNAFTSLNLMEPSTSYAAEKKSRSRITQNANFGSTSLPYMSPIKGSSPCTYIPVRNKYSDCGYDEEIEASDQPIDYSRKYAETKSANSNVLSSKNDNSNYSNNKTDAKDYSIYAETDLDQPTDYSLRYAEDDSDSDICSKISKQEYVQDTVKTYCTEGTPYETPFIFSNATSISDLRNMEDKQQIDNDIQKNKSPENKEVKNVDEKDRCSTEDISEIDNQKHNKSRFSSGLMSPEKPVNYCEEGTPGYFSRVSSFGSLNSIPANEPTKVVSKQNETGENSPTEKREKKPVGKITPKTPSEIKAVKFEQVVNYAEETPLMFSRSSSLASLDSIEQHSIHDDRSSVISDFSRLTSGIVSPSELPDSPTQTVPPSPRPRKTNIEYPSTSKRASSDGKSLVLPRTTHKASVFEDNITRFKEESTPIQFSTATSLSSLTIDDQDENETETSKTSVSKGLQNLSVNEPDTSVLDRNSVQSVEEQEKQDKEKESSSSDINDELAQDSDDEGDEDILAACISVGMQNNRQEYSDIRHNQNNPSATSTPSRLPLSNFKYQPKVQANIQILRRSPQSSVANITEEAPRTYCTEDTPAQLSRTGSNSNLSVLSLLNDNKSSKNYLSDDSSNFSGDNDNILAECIQSAMPKAKSEVTQSIPKQISSLPRPNAQAIKYNPPGVANVRREARKMQNIDKKDISVTPYLISKDELENYAVENSPCEFSLRSSLSDLTVDGSVAGLKTTRGSKTEGAVGSTNEKASTSKTSIKMNISEEHNTNDLDHRECLSSISIESLESIEAEKALLEQCIYSGMPTDKAEEALLEECISAGMPKSNSSSCIIKSSEVSSIRKPQEPLSIQQHSTEETEHDRRSKNVNAASVAGSTPVPVLVNEMRPDMSTTAADVEERGLKQGRIGAKKESRETKNQEEKIENHQGTLPDKCSHFGGNFLTDLTKSGSNKSLGEVLGNSFENDFPYNDPGDCGSINGCFSKSCEESGQIVDKRMLDPDAMIESLDRFTAELVSQASHLTKDEDKYKVSTNDNTWNEDTSPNEVTFPSISGSAPNVVTFDSDKDISNKFENDEIDGLNEDEPQSNDYLSTNTNTLTESTLIAIEASKMVSEFKKEAEMSHSITSAASLELDCIRPPSQLNSLSNSTIGLDRSITKSPIVSRKKSLPVGFLVKRALSNSVNRTTSLESLESNSLNNLDCMNPPSDIQNVFDLTNSMTNIASISNETASIKTDFVINGITNNDLKNMEHHNPIFNVKQQYGTSVMNICGDFTSVNQQSILENVNPPSIFNEITDLCNSLADIGTETICTENDVFEDCYTHMADITLQDDTEFSDANSVTPIQSDLSSAESTPKRTKNLSKSMMTKQRRNLARDRFKTYTVAAEMVMKEEEQKLKLQEEDSEQCAPDSTSEDFATIDDDKSEETTTYVSPTYTVSSSKLTPRERRQLNRSRFDTQVLDVAVTSALQNPDPKISESCDSNTNSPSPTRSKLSIRRNFMQKRLENKDRFKTRTLSESSFSPDISSASPPPLLESDLHLQLQKEANLVLKTLRDTKTIVQEELLDCETLSLVSNDDDSEHNSGSSMNYRTFHKSWGVRQNNIPVITSEQNGLVNCQSNFTYDQETTESTEEQKSTKPKIVKPQERQSEPENTSNEEQGKAIRGKRKPLYSKSNLSNKTKSIKPVKTMTSNLVKNVTSAFKSSASLNNANKETKTPTAKPPQIPNTKISSGYGRTSRTSSPKTSPARLPLSKTSPRHTAKGTPPLERQGTFTKDNVAKQRSRIPTPGSKIPTFPLNKPTSSGSRTPNTSIPKSNIMRNSPKSVSSDRIQRSKTSYNRSTSADSRETSKHITSSLSSHSLKTETKAHNGAVKKLTVSSTAHQSKSNSSVTSNGSTSAKKQVTSKIASLWKKIEETKNKQTTKNDTRVWIQNEAEPEQPKLIRSNTFDNEDKVILREKNDESDDPTKRVSRLGSFIVMEENEELLIQQTLNSKITTADVV